MKGIANLVMGWWLCIPIFLGIATVVASVEGPAESAEVLAPVLALCTALLLFTRYVSPGGRIRRRIADISIGLGSIGTAYLWMASALKVHPISLELVGTLAFLIFLVAVLALIFPMAVWIAQSGSDKDDE